MSPKASEPKAETEVNKKPVATGSAFSKFVDSIQFPEVFDKSPEEPKTFVATIENTSRSTPIVEKEEKKSTSKSEKFAKYIQKKTETKQTTVDSSASTSKPLTMNELTNMLSADHPSSVLQQQTTASAGYSSAGATNILTADLPDVANVQEKSDGDKIEENVIMTKFKEFKSKTITEVSKVLISKRNIVILKFNLLMKID